MTVRRTVPPILLLLLLLSACTLPFATRTPAQIDDGLPPAQPAAPETEAAPPQRLLPDAAHLREEPALLVRATSGATLYTGRGPWYLRVGQLTAGTLVTYLDSREGWLQVEADGGAVGWLNPGEAELRDGAARAVGYLIRPGRWAIQVAEGPGVELTRAAPGLMRVLVSGLPAEVELTELDRQSFAVLADWRGLPPSAIDIGDSGLARISLGPQGVLFDLESNPLPQVIRQGEGELELEFRPALERIDLSPGGIRLAVRGDVRPVLREEGGALILDLPGAVLAPGFGDAPFGLSLAEVAPERLDMDDLPLSSFRAAIPTRMTAGGLRITMERPAERFGLYRPAPGLVELRLLPAGLAGKRIMIDPGHGGEESGAVGVSGNPEKAVNLAVSLRLQRLLEAAGAQVLMTRTDDRRVLTAEQTTSLATASQRTAADLANRVIMANNAGVDLLISVHANGGPAGDGGIETFWATPNLNAMQSRHLAGLVQDELVAALGLADRGVKQRPFHMVRWPHAPAALAELGFMTNAYEEGLLISERGQQTAAEALFRAIRAYFSAG